MLALAILFALPGTIAQRAQAQTYSVIHSFTGGIDGAVPVGGLTMDAAGNLYGTTCGTPCFGTTGSSLGTIFRLTRRGSGWVFTPLYAFRGGNDGAGPSGRVVIGPDGSLYGTTIQGGGSGCGGTGCGTVFNLKPPPMVPSSVFGGWKETVVYSFQGGTDGAYPEVGDLILDQAGNIYGTASGGGAANAGMAFKLTQSHGVWTENVLHTFSGNDGAGPMGTLYLDGSGNLIGTTASGCDGYGTVFQLTRSESGYTEAVLHCFLGGSDGAYPFSGIADGFAGTTSVYGVNGGGTAFVLGNQMFNYSFPGNGYGSPYPGPFASLVNSPIGYTGTTYADGAHGYGSVFHMEGCAGWGAIPLYDFRGGTDGANPAGGVLFDASGNIFGTTSAGGAYGNGVVFEITPASNDGASCQLL